MPAHILAKPGDIAETVIACGDPARTEQLSALLEGAELVNSNRGFTTYSGRYRGKKVTISTHGIGGPSAAIVFEELHMLGAEVIVRFGTAGGLVTDLRIGDFVVPTAAMHERGSLASYSRRGSTKALPDQRLTRRIIEACESHSAKFRAGMVFSSDAFYGQSLEALKRWTRKGVIAVEMECATLFTVGRLRRFKTASLLVLSNSLVKKGEQELMPAERLRSYVDEGGRVLLEALAQA